MAFLLFVTGWSWHEVPAEEHAKGMCESYDDGVLGSLVTLREVVGQIGRYCVFIVDLAYVKRDDQTAPVYLQ